MSAALPALVLSIRGYSPERRLLFACRCTGEGPT